MTSSELENLAARDLIKREAPAAKQIETLLATGEARLLDAGDGSLALASRFDLAYNAAHALALAALRHAGYRSISRYMVFLTLAHTLGIEPKVWSVLNTANTRRNQLEYDGILNVDEQLVKDTISAAQTVRRALRSALVKD